MKSKNVNINPKRITVNRVAQFLDVSVVTVNNWYKWYNNPDFKKPDGVPYLPPYQQDHPRGVRYWTEDDLFDLKKFRDWIPRGRGGVMGDQNASYWGERGVRAKQNKEEKQKILKNEK